MPTGGYILVIGGVLALVSGLALLWFDKPVSKDVTEQFKDL
jgi:hypothetical protein